MNPILAFYRGGQVVSIHGEFACEQCYKVTYTAIYEIAKKKTLWECDYCEHENVVEGKEMEYE